MGARARGALHKTTELFLARTRGDEAVEQVYAAIAPEHAELLKRTRGRDWCPIEAFVGYMVTADRLFGNGDLKMCRDIGEASARWQLPMLKRFVLKLMSPLQMINHLPSIWSEMYDQGRLEVQQMDETRVLVRVFEFEPPHRSVCERVAGFGGAIIDMTGGRDPEITHPRCVTAGNLVCEYVVAWSPKRPTRA